MDAVSVKTIPTLDFGYPKICLVHENGLPGVRKAEIPGLVHEKGLPGVRRVGNPASSLPGRDIAVLFQNLYPFIDGEAPPAAGERDAAVVPAAYVGGLPGPPEGLVQ